MSLILKILLAIKKFSKDGNFINTFGSFGLGDGEFITPGGLGVDKENNIYATDFGENNSIQKFDENGKFYNEIWYIWNW